MRQKYYWWQQTLCLCLEKSGSCVECEAARLVTAWAGLAEAGNVPGDTLHWTRVISQHIHILHPQTYLEDS